jgi:hypothetical protein
MDLEKNPKNNQKFSVKGGNQEGKLILEWGTLNLSTTFQKG